MENIDTYMIVVEGNEASEYYANYCVPSWESFGLKVKRHRATTPKDLKKRNELKFFKYSKNAKYVEKNINAEITDTEKSVWYSHFFLWQECCFLNKPILILEHDTFLEHPERLWFDEKYNIIFFDKAAMGSYIITPKFAYRLIESAMNTTIGGGPYGFISTFKPKDLVVNDQHKKYSAASNQVMSEKYGNTIEHYCNLHPEHWSAKDFHNFIIIP